MAVRSAPDHAAAVRFSTALLRRERGREISRYINMLYAYLYIYIYIYIYRERERERGRSRYMNMLYACLYIYI